MKQVHVECNPDEVLITKLGFSSKNIIHHSGKSRVISYLKKNTDQLAVIDEDPGSVKTTYEKSLLLVEDALGIKYYTDSSGNRIFILTGKLEDWIIWVCKKSKISTTDFNLPVLPNELHDKINDRLPNFGKLIDHLLKIKNPPLLKLKSWLK